jgi:hypothetical protein
VAGWLRRCTPWVLLMMTAAVFAVYWETLSHGFLRWDDRAYVLQNFRLHGLGVENIHWMLSGYLLNHWHPLTWLSHAIDWHLWGDRPGMHHLGSVVLHAANTILVFLFVRLLLAVAHTHDPRYFRWIEQARRQAALLAAALFALHPQHVESVAWLAQRKDLLFTLFYLLALIAYLRAGGRPGARAWWLASLLSGVLSLLSEATAVSLPVMLLILDYWPLARITRHVSGRSLWRCALEKWPFFLLSIAVVVVTRLAQEVQTPGHDVWFARLFSAADAWLFYVGKWLFPLGLSPCYSFPEYVQAFSAYSLVPVVLLVAVSALCIRESRRGNSAWLAAWVAYLVLLLPVVGLLQAELQPAADRYSYLPGLVLDLTAAIILVRLAAATRWRQLAAVVVCAWLSLLGMLAVEQVAYWQNDRSVWERVTVLYPGQIPAAYLYMGDALEESGELQTALWQYRLGLEVEPGNSRLLRATARVQERLGETETALASFERLAVAREADFRIQIVVGDAFWRHDRLVRAAGYFNAAYRLAPDSPDALYRQAEIHASRGQTMESERFLLQAVARNPAHVKSQLGLARLYQQVGLTGAALAHYRIVLRLQHDNPGAQQGLDELLETPGTL